MAKRRNEDKKVNNKMAERRASCERNFFSILKKWTRNCALIMAKYNSGRRGEIHAIIPDFVIDLSNAD